MEKATDSLRADHESITTILNIMEAINKSIEADNKIDASDLDKVAGFLSSFADDYHHKKEENFLFPALAEAGMPTHGGPVAIMLQEHDISRTLSKKIGESATRYKDDGSGLEDYRSATTEYIFHLRQHVDKENNILFMMADVKLDQFAQADVVDSFDDYLSEVFTVERYESLQSTLGELKSKYIK